MTRFTRETGRRVEAFDLFIPGEEPPHMNSGGGLMRAHWAAVRRKIKAWEDRVWAAWQQAGRPIIRGPVSVETVRWYSPKGRAIDLDNLATQVKVPLDGLVRCGAIEDDRPSIVRSLRCYQDRVDRAGQRGFSFTVRAWSHESNR